MARKKNVANPFSITSYMGKEFFCDRETETEQLHKALSNGRNVTLISPRKMGKTGLIRHVFQQINAQEAYCFYVDIYDTSNLLEFTKKFAESVLTKRITPFSTRVWKEISRVFGSLRPTITVDPISGSPKCSVDVQTEREEITLQQIFAFLEKANKRCYVAFDEFQTIAEYADCKAEAVLRSYIQHLGNVNFIFAGSKKHLMLQMFSSASRPFFQSSQLMSIGPIPEDAYYDFALSYFQKHGQQIDVGTFHELYGMVEGQTWYVQVLLNRLYQRGASVIGKQGVLYEIDQWLQEQIPVYQTYSRLLTERQLAVLRAVAKEKVVSEPGSNSFLRKYALGGYSTVRNVLITLTNKELLYQLDNGDYCVYDRFFGIWLANT